MDYGDSFRAGNVKSLDGSTSGWSGVGTLLAGGENQTKQIIQYTFPRAGEYTVQLEAAVPPAPPGFDPIIAGDSAQIRTSALVTWIVRGNAIQRLVSLSAGTALTGNGESVWVSFIDDSEFTMAVPLVPQPYQVRASVVAGKRGSSSERPTFILPDRMNAAASYAASVAVPGANSWMFQGTLWAPSGAIQAANAMLVQFEDQPNNSVICEQTLLPEHVGKWFPLPRRATRVTASMNVPGQTATGRFILGIEG